MANNWENKTNRARLARRHTDTMHQQHQAEIDRCVRRTKVFDDDAVRETELKKEKVGEQKVVLFPYDSVTAVFSLPDDAGKTALLNFASFKNPGGAFIQGSKAQEECLCHESFLYNVLETKREYYEANREKTNRSLYYNRALYTPEVLFIRKDKQRTCDVITCAAPNWKAAKNYSGVTPEENAKALESRIQFIAKICQKFYVQTVILGAYGCGVFGQDPEQVVRLLKETFANTNVTNVVFAVPQKLDEENYRAFAKVLKK